MLHRMDLRFFHNQSLIEHLGYFHFESLKYFDENLVHNQKL